MSSSSPLAPELAAVLEEVMTMSAAPSLIEDHTRPAMATFLPISSSVTACERTARRAPRMFPDGAAGQHRHATVADRAIPALLLWATSVLALRAALAGGGELVDPPLDVADLQAAEVLPAELGDDVDADEGLVGLVGQRRPVGAGGDASSCRSALNSASRASPKDMDNTERSQAGTIESLPRYESSSVVTSKIQPSRS